MFFLRTFEDILGHAKNTQTPKITAQRLILCLAHHLRQLRENRYEAPGLAR